MRQSGCAWGMRSNLVVVASLSPTFARAQALTEIISILSHAALVSTCGCTVAAVSLLATSSAQASAVCLAVVAAGTTSGAAAGSAQSVGSGAVAASYAARLGALCVALHAAADAAVEVSQAPNPRTDPESITGMDAVLGALLHAWEEVNAARCPRRRGARRVPRQDARGARRQPGGPLILGICLAQRFWKDSVLEGLTLSSCLHNPGNERMVADVKRRT